MALILPGPLAQAISGRLGALCFSRQGGTPIVRTQPLPIRHDSTATLASRALLTQTLSQWKSLTPIQQAQWRNLARQTPSSNRLGLTRQLSGFNLWAQLALRNQLIDLPIPTAPAAADALNIRQPAAIEIFVGGPALLTYQLDTALPGPATTLYVQRLFSEHSSLPGRIYRTIHVPQATPFAYDFYAELLELFDAPTYGEYFLVDALSWTPGWPRSVPSRFLVQVSYQGPELVYNGGLEGEATPPDGWQVSGTGFFQSWAFDPYAGAASGYWVHGAADPLGWAQPSAAHYYTFTAGHTYILRFAYKCETTGIDQIAWYTPGDGWVVLGSIAYSGDLLWRVLTYSFTPTTSTAVGRIRFCSFTHVISEIWFDNVSLRSATPP